LPNTYMSIKLRCTKAGRVCYSNVTHRIPKRDDRHIGAGLIAPIPDYRIKAFEHYIDVYTKPSCLASYNPLNVDVFRP
jgi:hypothetical protein